MCQAASDALAGSPPNGKCYKPAMSRSLWRLLLTCILLIALPLKGVASVSLMPCGPDHGTPGAALLALPLGSFHDAVETGDADHDDVAEHDIRTTDAVQPDQAGAPGAALGHHHDAKLKCGNCAPCCLSLAPSSGAPLVLADQASLGEFPAQQVRYISAEVGSTLRPPQFLLA